jgi:hypothetical protein
MAYIPKAYSVQGQDQQQVQTGGGSDVPSGTTDTVGAPSANVLPQGSGSGLAALRAMFDANAGGQNHTMSNIQTIPTMAAANIFDSGPKNQDVNFGPKDAAQLQASTSGYYPEAWSSLDAQIAKRQNPWSSVGKALQ